MWASLARKKGRVTMRAVSGRVATACDLFFDNGSYYVQYFSDLPFGETPIPLADTGLPADFAPTAFVDETGTPDVFESFLYAAGPTPHTPTNSNFYNGVSDGRIPEPATMVLLGTALLGFVAALRRRV
jgi:hypothetical protein